MSEFEYQYQPQKPQTNMAAQTNTAAQTKMTAQTNTAAQTDMAAENEQPTQEFQKRRAITKEERQRMVRQANVGKRFCRNCGEEIQVGASVCVHCNTVLNPVAVRHAQEIVMNRQAKVTKRMLIKSFFFPRKGMKLYRENIANRPQVAEPCKKAAWAGRLTRIGIVLALVAFVLISRI